MSTPWSQVPLGDLLQRSERTVLLHPETTYREVTVRLNGKGVVERRQVQGVEIASDRRYEASSGQFIISRIDARHGASGLIPDELDGAVVTNDFPLFNIAKDRLDPLFLKWMSKTASFVELCKRASEGTTNRVRLSEDRFSALEIALPPLDEQRRIVARIEELAAKIEEARRISAERASASLALSASVLDMLLPKSAPEKPLGDLVMPGTSITYGVLVPGPDTPDGVPFVRVQDLSIKSAQEMPNKRISLEVAAPYRRTKLCGGEVLIAVVGATLGKIGIAPKSWAGANIARAVCRITPAPDVDARFLAESLSDRRCQDYFREQTRTLAQPTLNVGQLETTPIKLPPLEEQRRIVAELDALQAKVNAVTALQAETAAELDAMLPAILDKAFKGEL